MNRQLSEYLLSQIDQPVYIDKWCGTVQTIDKANVTPQQGTNRFPIGYALIGRDCGRDPLKPCEMVPDSKYKGILYFEDKGITQTSKAYSMMYGFNSNLRLVCWLNNKKVGADQTTNYLSTYAMADLTDKLTSFFQGGDIFKNVKAQVTGIAIQDKEIFSKYDYDDKITAYLQGEYTFFSIDFSVNFLIPKKCSFPFPTLETSIC